MADWYYAKEGRQQGPISAAQLRQMAQAGELQPEDLVFKEGGTNWIAASTVQGLFPAGGGARGAAVQPARASGTEGQAFNFEAAATSAPADEEGADIRRSSPSSKGGNFFIDLLLFRRMVAPTIILILFYLSVVFVILGGVSSAVIAARYSPSTTIGLLMAFAYLLAIPIGILVYRLIAEMMIVVFRIYETLKEMKTDQEKQRDKLR